MSDFYYIVGASRPTGMLHKLSSSILMLAEGCDYSHIHIEFPPGVLAKHSVMFDARNGQVNFSNEDTFDDAMHTVRQYMVTCSEKEFYETLSFCWQYCGIDYSYTELAGAAFARVAKWCGQDIDNPFGDGMKTEMCSSIASRLLKLSGVEIIGDVQVKSPKDVVNILDRAGFERIQ